jgi:hypothetical protein
MPPDDLRQTAIDHIRTAVARGRATCATIVSGTVEHLHGYDEPDNLYALAWELVGPEFAAHVDAQAGWPERTDNDRLTDAFRALDAAGIVAREDFARRPGSARRSRRRCEPRGCRSTGTARPGSASTYGCAGRAAGTAGWPPTRSATPPSPR